MNEVSDTTTGGRKSHRGRKIIIGIGAGALLLVLLVALLPTFISWGLFSGTITGQVSGAVNGTVTIGGVSVGWAGPIEVHQLKIQDPANNSSVDLTLQIDQGLWALITEGGKKLSGSIQGSASTRLEPDGSLAIQKMLKAAPAGEVPNSAEVSFKSRGVNVHVVPAGMDVSLKIAGIDVAVAAADGSALARVDKVNGRVFMSAGGKTGIELAGDASYLDTHGSFSLDANATGVIDSQGQLAFKGIPATVHAGAKNLRFTAGGVAMALESATLLVDSKDLTGPVEAAVEAKGVLDGRTETSLNANLQLAQIFTPAGKYTLNLGGIHGTVSGRNIPTPPLQQFLGDSRVVLTRDLGSVVDLTAAFADASGRGLKIDLQSQHLTLSVAGDVNTQTQAATLTTVTAAADVHPALAALAGLTVSGPAKVTLNAQNVVIPPRDSNGNLPTNQLQFSGTVAATLPGAAVAVGNVSRPLGVSAVQFTASAHPVEQGVTFDLSATPSAAPASPGPTAIASALHAKGTLVPGGRFQVHGSLDAGGIPTALIDPWLPEGLPVRLTDDLGAVINSIVLNIGAGDAPTLQANIDAPGLRFNAVGAQAADGSMAFSKVDAAAPALRPALLQQWGIRVSQPIRAVLDAKDVKLPSPSNFAAAAIAADASITVTPTSGNAVALSLGDSSAGNVRELQIGSTKLSVATSSMREKATLSLSSTVNDTAFAIGGTVNGIADAQGRFALEPAVMDLTVHVGPIAGQLVARELPDVAAIAESLGDGRFMLDGSVKGSLTDAQLSLALASGQVRVTATGSVQRDSLSLDADASLPITEKLLRSAAGELPVDLESTVQMTAHVSQTKLPRRGLWDFGTPVLGEITLSAPAVRLSRVEGLASGVLLEDARVGVKLGLAEPQFVTCTLKAGVSALPAAGTPLPVASADVSFTWNKGSAGPAPVGPSWSTDATLTKVNGPGLEEMLGMPAEARGQFTGGDVRAQVSQSSTSALQFDIVSHIDRLRATLKGDLDDGVLTLQPSEVNLHLPGPQVLALLNGLNDDKTSTWVDAEVLEVEAKVESLKMRIHPPAAELAARAAQPVVPDEDAETAAARAAQQAAGAPQVRLPSGFSSVVSVKVKPIKLTPLQGDPIRIDSASFTASAPGIGQPATVDGTVVVGLIAHGAPAATAVAPTMSLHATLRDWTTAGGTVAFDTMQIDGTATVTKAPTAVLGVLFGWGSELSDAVGPQVSADLTAKSTGPGAATVTANLDSEYLTVRAPRVQLDKGFIQVASDKPLVVSFQPSEPLRERVLEPINPVFSDIALADPAKPIQLSASMVKYPLDADYRRLSADVQLTVGGVLVSRNKDNQILNVLKVFQTPDNKPVQGQIDPLVVKVRNGQLTYENFNVYLEKQGTTWVTSLIFSGDIDLTTKPPRARSIAANYPMGSIARQMLSNVPSEDGGGDLQAFFNTATLGAMDMVQLRITFSGPLGEVNGKPMALKRKVKLDLKPGAIGQGIGGVVKDAGGILKDIFGGQKKQAPPPKKK